jgi:hypothetical protein
VGRLVAAIVPAAPHWSLAALVQVLLLVARSLGHQAHQQTVLA